MRHYLFVHFRETTSPEGEQVHFALSRDAFHWETLNGGRPILWAYYGDRGVRDMTVIRGQDGGFHIFATDLSLSYGMRSQYNHSWENITHHGSKCLAHWHSPDLIHWSEEELVTIGDEQTGCVWAPDILYDPESGDYILHYSCCRADNGYGPMAIYYSRTRDFAAFTPPRLLYRKPDSGCIDSAMYAENGRYYLFVKSDGNPERVILLTGDRVTGPWTRVEAFDRPEHMGAVQSGKYEAPTAVRTEDGRWCLFVDYYGVRGAGQGYVPFLADSLESGAFVRSDAAFSFPYGFKHGTILPITEEEYECMKEHDWTDVPDGRWL